METEVSTTFVSSGSSKEVELSLGGHSVLVKTDATPASLKSIREMVEIHFETLKDKTNHALSTHDLTLLVAYNLAEELLNEKEKHKALKKIVVERSERLLNRVESHLNQEF